jgi:hypothetical protein
MNEEQILTSIKVLIAQANETFSRQQKLIFESHLKFTEEYKKILSENKNSKHAKSLVQITEGGRYENQTFFTLQCVQTNYEPCQIETENGIIVFPEGSFFKGALYPINLICLVESGGAQFVGYES